MPLSLDDEVFVEKCFQRSLLVCADICWCGFIMLRPLWRRNSTSSFHSAGRRLLCGGARERSASSHQNSACSPNGRWRNSWGGKSIFMKCATISFSSLVSTTYVGRRAALRGPVRGGVLGELCLARFREQHALGILALRPAQAFRDPSTFHILLLHTERPV